MNDLVKAAAVDLAPLAADQGQALIKTFTEALEQLEACKPSRQRSLAITKLEEAFTHAVFALAGVESPIRYR